MGMSKFKFNDSEYEIKAVQNGYNAIIDGKTYLIISEGQYDQDKPINKRHGEIVYLSTLNKKYPELSKNQIQDLQKALLEYSETKDPNFFINFN